MYCRSTTGVTAKVATSILPKGCWMLTYILKYVLGGGLLLKYIAILGYCIKLLGNWMLNTVKASILCTARTLP